MAAYSGSNRSASETWEHMVLCKQVAYMTHTVELRHAGHSIVEVVSSLLIYMVIRSSVVRQHQRV